MYARKKGHENNPTNLLQISGENYGDMELWSLSEPLFKVVLNLVKIVLLTLVS
ncbi:TPA: hypothetical protein ACGW3F_003146 [Bacillus paranthracis]